MYVFNVENLDEELINKILNNDLAVDIRLDNIFLLSKEKEIVVDGQMLHNNYSLEEYIRDMYDGGEYIELPPMQVGINEVIDVLVDRLYTKTKNENISYSERIYESENPDKEILAIIDECVFIELENKLKEMRKSINTFKKQVQIEGIKWK